jgi:tetratricopeptide (TPR) repeat protein
MQLGAIFFALNGDKPGTMQSQQRKNMSEQNDRIFSERERENQLYDETKLVVKPETHPLPAKFWGKRESAERLWHACLQPAGQTPIARLRAGIRLFYDDSKVLSHSNVAWTNGAVAAAAGISQDQLMNLVGDHRDAAAAAVSAIWQIRDISGKGKYAEDDQRAFIQRLWGDDPAKHFGSVDTALAVAALTGWQAYQEGHVTSVRVVYAEYFCAADIFLINMLRQEVEGLEPAEKDEVLSWYLSSRYKAHEFNERQEIIKAAAVSIRLARNQNWDVRRFVLDGHRQARELVRCNPERALVIMEEIGMQNGVNRMAAIFDRHVGNLQAEHTWDKVIQELFDWYPTKNFAWTYWTETDEAGLVVVQQMYDSMFWLGLLQEACWQDTQAKRADKHNGSPEHLWDAIVFYALTRQHQKSIERFHQLISLESNVERVACAFLEVGRLMARNKHYDAAVGYFREAFVLKPTNDPVWYHIYINLGFSLCELGQYVEAESYCRKAMEINPREHNAHQYLGLALEGQARYVEAARGFIMATELNPRDSQSVEHLKRLLKQQPELRAVFGRDCERCCEAVERVKCEQDWSSAIRWSVL